MSINLPSANTTVGKTSPILVNLRRLVSDRIRLCDRDDGLAPAVEDRVELMQTRTWIEDGIRLVLENLDRIETAIVPQDQKGNLPEWTDADESAWASRWRKPV